MQQQQYKQQAPQLQVPPEELARLRKEAILGAFPRWSEEDLETLRRLYQERGWKLFFRYLAALEEQMEREMWNLSTDDRKSTFLRGERHVLEVIKRAPQELEEFFAAKRERGKEQ